MRTFWLWNWFPTFSEATKHLSRFPFFFSSRLLMSRLALIRSDLRREEEGRLKVFYLIFITFLWNIQHRCVIATSNFPASIAHTTSEFPHRDEIYHQAHTTSYYTPHWGRVKDPIFIRVWRRNKIQWLKRGTTCRGLCFGCRLQITIRAGNEYSNICPAETYVLQIIFFW